MSTLLWLSAYQLADCMKKGLLLTTGGVTVYHGEGMAANGSMVVEAYGGCFSGFLSLAKMKVNQAIHLKALTGDSLPPVRLPPSNSLTASWNRAPTWRPALQTWACGEQFISKPWQPWCSCWIPHPRLHMMGTSSSAEALDMWLWSLSPIEHHPECLMRMLHITLYFTPQNYFLRRKYFKRQIFCKFFKWKIYITWYK